MLKIELKSYCLMNEIEHDNVEKIIKIRMIPSSSLFAIKIPLIFSKVLDKN